MDKAIRPLDRERDHDAIVRIWREVRWIDDTDEQATAMASFLADDDTEAEVGTLDGTPECLVVRRPGSITYDTTDVPLTAVAAVTTSHRGRKLGLASTMTARCIAAGALDGAAVAALGMFEQGFYDRFGFGTASYDHRTSFDPQLLRVDHVPYRTPVRLGADDAVEMAAAMRARLRHHGAVVLRGDAFVRAEFDWLEHPMALGYRDADGTLTHFFAGSLKDENGPLEISLIAYRSIDELMELLRLLRELGDQLRSVVMIEPAALTMQVLLDAPMRSRQRSIKSEMESVVRSVAWWQLRIVDLLACVAARRWDGEPIEFDLTLSDPIETFFDHDRDLAIADDCTDLGAWRGVGGEYTIRLGTESSVEPGHSGLPTIRCDVGAFSRLWFGVAPASTLHATDRFEAPTELTTRLDRAFRLPPTIAGLMF